MKGSPATLGHIGDVPSADGPVGLLVVGNFLSNTIGNRSVCEDLSNRLVQSGWRVLTTSYKRPRILRLLDMVRTAWRQRNAYDVALVEVFSGRAFFWAEAVCWVLRHGAKPYILTLHGGSLPSFARNHAARVTRLLNSAGIVTAPSRYLIETMRPYRSNLQLLPNGLDLSGCSFMVRSKPRPQLVWLRAFHAIYNPVLAVRVLSRLNTIFPDVHLTMIGPDKGDGSLRAVKDAAAELGVADRISLPGAVAKDEVFRWLGTGDIFLNTTNVDNTPISVLEAMACGLCVVSTDVGGIPYLLEDERDALLVPANDERQMTDAVCRVLRDHELAERLSTNGRSKAEQHDWSRVVPHWNRAVLEVFAEGS